MTQRYICDDCSDFVDGYNRLPEGWTSNADGDFCEECTPVEEPDEDAPEDLVV